MNAEIWLKYILRPKTGDELKMGYSIYCHAKIFFYKYLTNFTGTFDQNKVSIKPVLSTWIFSS